MAAEHMIRKNSSRKFLGTSAKHDVDLLSFFPSSQKSSEKSWKESKGNQKNNMQ